MVACEVADYSCEAVCRLPVHGCGRSARSNSRIKSGKSHIAVDQMISKSTSKYTWIKRFRIPITIGHGIPGRLVRHSVETLLAASPIISSSLVKARTKSRVCFKSSCVLPSRNESASTAASSMCCKRSPSLAFILNDGRRNHRFSEIAAEFGRRAQIDLSSDGCG